MDLLLEVSAPNNNSCYFWAAPSADCHNNQEGTEDSCQSISLPALICSQSNFKNVKDLRSLLLSKRSQYTHKAGKQHFAFAGDLWYNGATWMVVG